MKKLLLTALVGLSLTAFAEPQTLKYGRNGQISC